MVCKISDTAQITEWQNVAGTNPALAPEARTNHLQFVRKCSDPTKENAASDGAEHGVYGKETVKQSHNHNTPKRGRSAMSKWAKPAHKKTARAIGYALTLGTEAAWHGLTIVLMARLSDEERAALAFAALMSLSNDHASSVAEVAV